MLTDPRSRPWRSGLLVLSCVSVALAFSSPARAQSSCYDCHQAQEDEQEAEHLQAWHGSAHDRAGVRCEHCHRGDGQTLVQIRAHAGVYHSSSKKASTHQSNLALTCGSCHETFLQALQESSHWKLFEDGSKATPQCRTCHGALATQSLGTGGLNAECTFCHRDEGTAAPDLIAGAGELLSQSREVGHLRSRAGRLVLRIRDLALRHDAGDLYFQGDQSWTEALEALHAFDSDSMRDSLSNARVRFEQLIAEFDEQ